MRLLFVGYKKSKCRCSDDAPYVTFNWDAPLYVEEGCLKIESKFNRGKCAIVKFFMNENNFYDKINLISGKDQSANAKKVTFNESK